jgi:hypothetical protein
MKGGAVPLLLDTDLGVSVGGAGKKMDLTAIRTKMEKITMTTPKKKKYISL